MNKAILLASVAGMIASVANATEITPYISAKMVYSAIKSDVKESWIGSYGEETEKEKANDSVWGASIAFGAQKKLTYGALRSELELTLRDTASKKYKDVEYNENWKNSVTANSLMLNLYYDIDTGTNITPYVGAGIGVARLKGKYQYQYVDGEYSDSDMLSKKKNNFAWALTAGVAYKVTDHVAVDLGYRYTDMGDVTAKRVYAEYNEVEKHKFDANAHEVLLGVRYSF